MTDRATDSSVTARRPHRHFDLRETDALAAASARDDAPSPIRSSGGTTKSAATATPVVPVEVSAPAAPVVTIAAVARKQPVQMIPLVSASTGADVSGSAEAAGGCCGGSCCS